MNPTALLALIPLIFAVFWTAWLLFKKDLPSEALVKILSYFAGVIIVFSVVGFLAVQLIPSWANNLLNSGRESEEYNEFQDTFGEIWRDAMGLETPVPTLPPTPRPAPPTLAPEPGEPTPDSQTPEPTVTGGSDVDRQGQNQPPARYEYIVRYGDTLFSIARSYGTTVETLVELNGLADPNAIEAGQVLKIP